MKKKPTIAGNQKKVKKLSKKLKKKSFNKAKMSKKKLMKKRKMLDKEINTRIELIVQELVVAFNVVLVMGIGVFIVSEFFKELIKSKKID